MNLNENLNIIQKSYSTTKEGLEWRSSFLITYYFKMIRRGKDLMNCKSLSLCFVYQLIVNQQMSVKSLI